jgi:hypothetical protein
VQSQGGQLLSGSGLPDEKDRGLVQGHALQGCKDGRHSLASRHHRAESARVDPGLHIGLRWLGGGGILSKEELILSDLDLISIVQRRIGPDGSAIDFRAVSTAIRQTPATSAAA